VTPPGSQELSSQKLAASEPGPRSRAGLVPENVLLPLKRELDAFREGNYVPIINEHC